MLSLFMLKADQKDLPNDVFALKKIIRSQQKIANKFEKENSYLKSHNSFLIQELRLALLKLYKRLSERFKEDLEDVRRLLFEDWPQEVEEFEPEEEAVVIKEHQRKKTGRKSLPKDLPRVEIIHDIPEEDKHCGCGCEKSRIGEEVSEKLQIEPARLWVDKHIRPKYACKSCEGVEDHGKAVSIAPVEPQIIPRSFAGPSLLAHILIGKFCDALPFYRQEQQFKRYDVQISRATMCNWSFYVADRLKPLLKMLRLFILSGPLINIDETPVQVLREPDRSVESQSYMWVYMGGMTQKPAIYYQYSPSRSGRVAREFLGDFKGYIQTDGYQGYNFLKNTENIIHSGCWAHVRRKFTDVINAAGKNQRGEYKGSSKANYALRKIRDLYFIEQKIRNKNLEGKSIYDLRQEKSLPIIKELKSWLMETTPKVPPQCLLGRALNYTLNQWPTLVTYLDTSFVPMDNNLVENAIRPFAIGRKNWMFSVSPMGAESSALFYSLIETAKTSGLEPYKYLKYLLEKFPQAKTTEEIFNLLPMNINKLDLL